MPGSSVLAVVFDLDGTLIDSAADIAAAANHSLRNAGLPERTQSDIQAFIGDGSRMLLARASGLAPSSPELEAMLSGFFSYYTEHAIVHTRLLPGARETLAALAHLPLALCTNKPRPTTLAVLRGLALEQSFRAVVAAGDVPHHKPHPAPLARVAELLDVPCSRLVLVGDGPQDVLCARAAGARSIAISDEVIVPLDRVRAAGPDAIVPLRDVAALVTTWEAQARSNAP